MKTVIFLSVKNGKQEKRSYADYRKDWERTSDIMKAGKEGKDMERMTVGQLAMAVGKEDRIYISSIYDISRDVELTNQLRAYTGILSLEVLSLAHHEDGFIAVIDLPAAAIAALAEEI